MDSGRANAGHKHHLFKWSVFFRQNDARSYLATDARPSVLLLLLGSTGEANILPEVDRNAQEGERAWQVIRPRFFDGFHRCIAALAGAGNSLIVEHVIEFQSWLDDCVRLLAPFDVFFVGVHCPLVELERRERERGNRAIGEGRSHLLDGVHTWSAYDFEVDTSVHTPAENARLIQAALANKPNPSAFCCMYAKQNEAKRSK